MITPMNHIVSFAIRVVFHLEERQSLTARHIFVASMLRFIRGAVSTFDNYGEYEWHCKRSRKSESHQRRYGDKKDFVKKDVDREEEIYRHIYGDGCEGSNWAEQR